jgi:hypothetical protein
MLRHISSSFVNASALPRHASLIGDEVMFKRVSDFESISLKVTTNAQHIFQTFRYLFTLQLSRLPCTGEVQMFTREIEFFLERCKVFC